MKRISVTARRLASAAIMGPARAVLLNRFHPKVGAYLKNIKYAEGAGRQRCLDVAIPDGEGPFPVLVFIHGGGFFSGDKKLLTRLCKSYAKEGFVVFNINYRLAPEHVFPSQCVDCHLAMRWIRENARRFKGDRDKIFIGGESAGATLSAIYAAAAFDEALARELFGGETVRSGSIRGLLLFYGVYDFETVLSTGFPDIHFITHTIMGEDEELYRKRAGFASPIRHVTPDYPPCFVCASERDYLHSESVRFSKTLGEKGVRHEFLSFDIERYPHAHHGFMPAFFFECTKMAMRKSVGFMREVLQEG